MGQPPSILYVHNGLDWVRGSERCLLDLVAHLDRGRFRPIVACNGTTLATAAEKLGAMVYSGQKYVDTRGRFLPDSALVREARRIVREQNIRLIHANAFEPVKWLLPAARAARIPMVLHVHIPTSREERCYTWAHQVAQVVGVSRAALYGFLDDGLPPERTSIIYNAVDPARLGRGDATALRADLGIPREDLVLTVVGSLIHRKGLDVLLRALAQVRAAGPGGGVWLLLVGEGPEREGLERLATSLGVRDIVRFLGTRTDVGAILRDATDIALSGARAEALPLNVLEAGFFGRPMVASDIPPHRELIDDGRTGVLVPGEDPAAFAAAIAAQRANARMRKALGESARERVHSRFLIDRYVREFSDLYTRLLESPARTYGWVHGGAWPRAYTEWLKRAGYGRLGVPLPLPASGRTTRASV